MTEHALLECTRCLYTIAHPLHLTIDADGVCSGCRVHEEKDSLDWPERFERLKSIVAPYRSKRPGVYDCIVPVTGANDSYFTVHVVKHELGMNPLLVAYNKYFNSEVGIRNLANLRITFDCDILVQNVNPECVKRVTRTTLREFGSVYWPILAGQTAFPVQTAVRFGVPLIIWGAHQGVEQVGMFSYTHEVEMTRRYRKDHDLLGREADDLISDFDSLTEDDIWQFRYPSDDALAKVGVRGIYLNNFIRWDPLQQHLQMIEQFDYRPCARARTFDTYDHVDCACYMGVHDLLKFAKHGYGKVTDQLCREIRFGRVSRDDALRLKAHYERQPAEHMETFLRWINMTDSGFAYAVRNTRPEYPVQKSRDAFVPETPVIACRAGSNKVPGFLSPPDTYKAFAASRNFITVGKGWP